MAGHPVSRRALDPPAYARGWFATRRTVGLRQALNDGVGAISFPTKEAAQKQADSADEAVY